MKFFELQAKIMKVIESIFMPKQNQKWKGEEVR